MEPEQEGFLEGQLPEAYLRELPLLEAYQQVLLLMEAYLLELPEQEEVMQELIGQVLLQFLQQKLNHLPLIPRRLPNPSSPAF